MKLMWDRQADIYTAKGWIRGWLGSTDARISHIEGEPIPAPSGAYRILPGFIDLHVHGGGGADVMKGVDDIRKMLRFHARSGTAALCPTTVTAPVDAIEQALSAIASVSSSPAPLEAAVLGAHVEGPFVNPLHLGGQPPFAIDPDIELLKSWIELCDVRIVTLAPELPGAQAAIRFLKSRNIRVQVGHSAASAEQLDAASAWGLTGVTHLFNATPQPSSRNPGVQGWALAKAQFAELICDGLHVHPDMISAAVRAIPGAFAITDCCSAAGCEDGEYMLGNNIVVKSGNRVHLPGTDKLAASTLVGIAAFRNLIAFGHSMEQAIRMTAELPARYIGATDFGSIALDKVASVVALNAENELVDVWQRGERLEEALG